jgi:hypothetical protein
MPFRLDERFQANSKVANQRHLTILNVRSRYIMPGFSLTACLSLAACDVPTASIDPPELNPHPSQGVTLYVSAPESLKVRVAAYYRVGHWLGLGGGGGEYCGHSRKAKHDQQNGKNSGRHQCLLRSSERGITVCRCCWEGAIHTRGIFSSQPPI